MCSMAKQMYVDLQVTATELSTPVPWGNDGTSFGQALLQPTTIYVQPLLKLISLVKVKVMMVVLAALHPRPQQWLCIRQHSVLWMCACESPDVPACHGRVWCT